MSCPLLQMWLLSFPIVPVGNNSNTLNQAEMGYEAKCRCGCPRYWRSLRCAWARRSAPQPSRTGETCFSSPTPGLPVSLRTACPAPVSRLCMLDLLLLKTVLMYMWRPTRVGLLVGSLPLHPHSTLPKQSCYACAGLFCHQAHDSADSSACARPLLLLDLKDAFSGSSLRAAARSALRHGVAEHAALMVSTDRQAAQLSALTGGWPGPLIKAFKVPARLY